MELFDTNIANQLQYVSLPLELIGLTLATIVGSNEIAPRRRMPVNVSHGAIILHPT
jgi:hypothetical protein